MPSSKTTGVGIFGFQAETDLICPLEIKLAQEFLPDATKALDFAEYLTFQIGLFIVLFIVFAETGLFAGFFLPGDSLLFLSGIYAEKLAAPLRFIPETYSDVTVVALAISLAAARANNAATPGEFWS